MFGSRILRAYILGCLTLSAGLSAKDRELTDLKNACLSVVRAIDGAKKAEVLQQNISELLLKAKKATKPLPPLVHDERSSRLDHTNQARVQKVLAILKANLEFPPSLKELGRQVGCSEFYLSRIFSSQTGKTISATLRDLRLDRAAVLLREGRNVTEAATEMGYSSFSHFSAAFRERFGICPKDYR